MQEFNTFDHASRHAGKMHACGHDGHTAMLLAAAQHFSKNRQFDGTVYLIFQPAEEGGGGAREMIRDGLFKQFPVEAVFGMHNWPGEKVGNFAIAPGPVMASSNEFKITIRGKGSHAALPHNGIDPVPIACQMVLGFQTIISRNKKPIDAGVVSVTMIHAGEATNVVPDFCELQGTVRTFSIEVLDLIEARMKQIAEHTCAAYDATCEFEFVRNYPPTINSAPEAEFARQVMNDIVGADHVMVQEPTMGAEDFAYMLLARPEIGSLAELKGKRVAIEQGTYAPLLLDTALAAAGLRRADVTTVHLPIGDQRPAWRKGEIDAAVTYAPFADELVAAGAHRLFDSRQMPDTIVDVLAVRNESLSAGGGDALRHLLAAHFRTLAFLADAPDDAARLIGARRRSEAVAVASAYDGLILPDLEKNRLLLAGAQPVLLEKARLIGEAMRGAGLLSGSDDLNGLVNGDYFPASRKEGER